MQNDIFASYDEVEPRQMPRPVQKFDSRPTPIVPEVSLIMEKSKQASRMDDTLSNSIPELRTSIPRNSTFKGSESYAAWREKQFPQQSTRTQSSSPSRLHQIYSSSRSTSNLQDPDNYRRSMKTGNSLDNHDYGYRNQSPGRESPKRYSTLKRSGHIDPNKYTLSHARSSDEIDRHESNSYNYTPRTHRREESPNDRRRSDHAHVIETYESRQKPRIHRSSSCSNADAYAHRNVPIEHDYHTKHSKSLEHPYYSPEHIPRHSRSLPPAHYSPEHSHSHAHHTHTCCVSSHNNSNSETETVKNLLQVITSQNEQIKNLQKQVERLLKLHEQSLRDRNQCTCQPNGVIYQNAHLYDQSRTANLPIAHNNLMKENEKNFSDLKYQEEKSKPTILEQKVSIGVMTSFELKVQNNPSLATENEYKQKSSQEKVLQNLPTSNMIKNLVNDTGEMIRKKSFNPTVLENISEGSESRLGADSTRQSIEAQDPVEVQNTNLYRQNLQEHEHWKINSESRKQKNGFADKNNRRTSDLDYEIREPRYERTRNEMQERAQYEYNRQEYDNIRSSPHEDLEEKKSAEFHNEPILADIIKMKNTKADNFADECLSLSSSELDVEDPSPPSPEPSIHLDMQEYSSEGGSLPPQRKVGWTLYNNVLDQVNQILQNSNTNDDDDDENPESPDGVKKNKRKEYENNVIMDTVKAATLDQLTKLGISFSDNVDQREPNYNKKVIFDASYYTRQGPEAHMAATSGSIETNTSMHMKALAMKYLNDDQLADMALQKSRPNAFKQPPSNANMSFATMHYLQRYHLLPGTNSSPMKEVVREEYRAAGPVMNERLAMRTAERREQSPHRYQAFTGTSKVSYPSKILDISTLKQQPKLL